MSAARVSTPGAAAELALLAEQPDMLRALIHLAKRRGLSMHRAGNIEELVAWVKARDGVAVVVVDLHALSRPAHALLAECLAAHPRPPALVVVARKAWQEGTANRLARLPGARLVEGGPRFIPRMLEVVAETTGVRPRRHPRRSSSGSGVLETPDGDLHRVQLINISLSGARVSLASELPVGTEAALRLSRDGLALSARIRVMRVGRAEAGGFFAGVQFDAGTPGQELAAWMALPEDGPIEEEVWAGRADSRLHVPARLKAKARVDRAERRRLYCDVVDLSDAGFRGVPGAACDLKAGDQVEVLIYWSRGSLKATCEVVHATGTTRAVGFRFVTASPEARAQLAALILESRARGLKREKSAVARLG